MKTSEFDYELPSEMIAQTPVEPRDASRLLVLDRCSSRISHHRFREIGGFLRPGDLLVANDSRVIPARLLGRKETGGRAEVFLLRRRQERIWEVLVRGRRLGPGTRVEIHGPQANGVGPPFLWATIIAETAEGGRVVEFNQPVEPLLENLGIVPLPPYVHQPLADAERYQTVYARVQGSVAAPTAGLHFTTALIDQLQAQGVGFGFVTLHVGQATFRPVKSEHIEDHPMHSEWAELPLDTAQAIDQTRTAGGRVIAVGTTAVRTLEAAAALSEDTVRPFRGWTDVFVTPGYRFRVVDALLTNFHLPRSTLLMLVSAFAGKEAIDRAYQEAIDNGYRFYSFGDAMLIV
jgi:S-adenosylmethionine:tRNA ribosyltransferase-isomerase